MCWDVVVAGAGAAGLLAAIRAAERGRRTLLLEKNRKPGAKILMSGGTRCNITHNTDARGIVEAYGHQGRFLHSALAAFSPADVVALFEAEGVVTKVEESGKIFPASDHAADVLAALLSRLERSHCELRLSEPLVGLSRSEHGFRIVTSESDYNAGAVIVTTGGQSYPGCGTTGDAYRWMSELGHTIIPPRPALTPITTNATWVTSLKGVTIPDVALRVVVSDRAVNASEAKPKKKNKPLDERRGSFLFTHFGLSGPVALDISRTITGHPEPTTLDLECDFLPMQSVEQVEAAIMREVASDGKKQLIGVFSRVVPRRLAEALFAKAGINPELKAAEMSKATRQQLVEALKRSRIPVSGTRGFKKAEVTAGGVKLSEVDSSTMESKLVPNLYLAGEVLDLDGPIGGFNFQAAFSTAWLAGSHV
ncbi:MAG: NAD(P)/FAD-dependent oxidoreductase [Planctomycetaceae bacterium]|nr:NAD(P)/FAD-dependent oxidoreductase [Planctomycetales bacterium]MCB9921538.1 NAD(P)/FAD-dependent oxidoreductase [Planctomycetaceae bacterium]